MRFLWRSQIERGQKALPRPEKKVRRPVPRRSHGSPILLFFLWLFLFGTLVYTLLFSPFLSIDLMTLRVTGTERVAKEKVEELVREELAQPWLGIFPKNNFVMLRPDELAEKLSLRFPLFSNIIVQRSFPHGLEVKVQERAHLIVWCAGGPCYLITEQGKARDATWALAEENQKFVRTIVDTSAQPVRMGQVLFSYDLPRFIKELEPLFEEELGLVVGTELLTPSRFAGELRLRTTEGFWIYVNTELEPRKTVGALRLIFEKELPSEKRQALEYIDARAENRVYYLLKPSAETSSQPEAPSEAEKEEKKKD